MSNDTAPIKGPEISRAPNDPLGHQSIPTALIALANGQVFFGQGFGATGDKVGELCFNTSLTGYQEILTDPSYAGQIITFTFPHIGNVGCTAEDMESLKPAALGLVVRELPTAPANWRSEGTLIDWLVAQNLIGIAGVDTRALTQAIRDEGAPNAVIAHNPSGEFDLPALIAKAKAWPGLEGLDLAATVTCTTPYEWDTKCWDYPKGYQPLTNPEFHVVAVDYGAKQNILRCLASAGCKVTVVPANTSAEQILAYRPDGVFLSNGPGDPAATGVYAVPIIKALLASRTPLFGICLGHQLLALSLGAKTTKMPKGHRGANHPVMDLTTGKVEVTSQNHGFMVLPETLPSSAKVTHYSLFDKTNEGLELVGQPAFSVQYHPEASPGPEDSHYLFERFVSLMRHHKKQAA